jgi:hypothetical protein
MYLKLLFAFTCYILSFVFSFALFGQELLKNGGFEEVVECEVCSPYYGYRVREMLKNGWSFFLSDAFNCPGLFIWNGIKFENLVCNQSDSWKFKNHCSEVNLNISLPLLSDEKIVVTACTGDFFEQKLSSKIKKGSICQLSAVFNLYKIGKSKFPADTLLNRISFFLSKDKPKLLLTNKQRAAEAKRCNLKLVGEIYFDSLALNTWHEKSFQFVADSDYEYFFGGAPAIEFFEPERDNLRGCIIMYDRLSLKLIAAPISEELKKIALSADSLSSTNLYAVRGRFVRVKGAVFLKNSSLPQSVSDLDKIADFLLKNPNQKIRIEGHADEDGDSNYNLKLSESRASAVKTYLIAKGIKAENIDTKGFGSSSPVSKLKADNRRVEIVFLE